MALFFLPPAICPPPREPSVHRVSLAAPVRDWPRRRELAGRLTTRATLLRWSSVWA
jgi:hypothetical protein